MVGILKSLKRLSTMYKLKRRAITLFRNSMISKHVQRHNQRAWIASILQLGDKHILAIPVGRPYGA